MQYLLTREEVDNLVDKKHLEEARKAAQITGALLLRASGFTCIHDQPGGGYCDDCPISKGRELSYSESRIVCTRPRNYSK